MLKTELLETKFGNFKLSHREGSDVVSVELWEDDNYTEIAVIQRDGNGKDIVKVIDYTLPKFPK